MLDKSQKENYTALTKMAAAKSSVAFIFISLPDISHAEEYEGEEAAKIMAEIIEINNILKPSICICPTI